MTLSAVAGVINLIEYSLYSLLIGSTLTSMLLVPEGNGRYPCVAAVSSFDGIRAVMAHLIFCFFWSRETLSKEWMQYRGIPRK